MHSFLQFLSDYQVLIAALLPVVFAFIRSTKWGKANQEALTKVAEVIEGIGDRQLKADIAAKFETATQGQKDAINHVVSVVDPAKTPLTTFELLVLDLSRALMPKPKEGK